MDINVTNSKFTIVARVKSRVNSKRKVEIVKVYKDDPEQSEQILEFTKPFEIDSDARDFIASAICTKITLLLSLYENNMKTKITISL